MARPTAVPMSRARDPQVAQMVGLSAAAHVGVLFVLLVVMPPVKPSPPPLVAYTVELTDSSSLGGRLAPGRTDLPMGARPGANTTTDAPAKQGEPAPTPTPEPIAKATPPPPVEAPKPVEPPKPIAKAPEPPKPIEPAVKLPSIEKPPPPKPEAKKPEPKPEPKAEAKPEPKPEPKPEAKKPEPAKPEPAKPAAAKPEPPKAADATTKPAADAARKATAEAKPVGKPTGKPEGSGQGEDAYASAADKWRTKGASGGGGGLGGTDTSPGPMGTPGYGGGGGGQVVGFEFLAYQQRVVSTVKGVWTNAAPRPGLVAKVEFRIAANGDVSGIRLAQPSGDGVFDASVMRAVERANPLPPPPARYANEFREFMIEFHSEEGGQAAG